jgi:metallo-beta-lactamase class B
VKPRAITKDIYLIGSSEITDPQDCCIYLLDVGELVLIDTGAGESYDALLRNIKELGLDPAKIKTVILTHCHIDHIGGARRFREALGCRLIMHELDAQAVERGDKRMTGASWYRLPLSPLPVDVKLTKDEERLPFGDQEVVCLHTPGHTPGSLSLYVDQGGKRVLFGQDIHGPFLEEFGADLAAWRRSMQRLLALEADILCEGHFGIYQPKDRVAAYIERYLDQYGETG